MFFSKRPALEQSPEGVIAGLLQDALDRLQGASDIAFALKPADEALRLIRHLPPGSRPEVFAESVHRLVRRSAEHACAHDLGAAAEILRRAGGIQRLLPVLNIDQVGRRVVQHMLVAIGCQDCCNWNEERRQKSIQHLFEASRCLDQDGSFELTGKCLEKLAAQMLDGCSCENLALLLKARTACGLDGRHPAVVSMMVSLITSWPPWVVYAESRDSYRNYIDRVLGAYGNEVPAELVSAFQRQLEAMLDKQEAHVPYLRFHGSELALLVLSGWVQDAQLLKRLAKSLQQLGIKNAAKSLLKRSLETLEKSHGGSSFQLCDVLLTIGNVVHDKQSGKRRLEQIGRKNRYYQRLWEILQKAIEEKQDWVCAKLVDVASGCEDKELQTLCLQEALRAADWTWNSGLKDEQAIPLLIAAVEKLPADESGDYAVKLVSIIGLGRVHRDINLHTLSNIAKQHFEEGKYWVPEAIYEYLLSLEPEPVSWFMSWFVNPTALHPYSLDYGEMRRCLPFCRR